MTPSTFSTESGGNYQNRIQFSNITLRNTGSRPANISLEHHADPLLDFTAPDRVVLGPNTSEIIPVTVRLADPSDDNTGRYPFTITATPVDERRDPSTLNASGTAVFTQDNSFVVIDRVETATEEVSGEQRQQVTATVTNEGTAPAEDAWIMFHVPSGWTVVDGPANVSLGALEPGKQQRVTRTLKPNGTVSGSHRIELRTGSESRSVAEADEHSLSVTAEEEQSTSGTTEEERSAWKLYPALVLLAAIGIIVGLYRYRSAIERGENK